MSGTTRVISQDYSKLVGIPYEKKNCFAIVADFYSLIFHTSIYHYYDKPDLPPNQEVECLIRANKGDFIKVDKPEFGDIILLKIRGIERHLGVYIDDQKFLHTTRGTGSVLDSLERHKNVIVGYYRLKAA